MTDTLNIEIILQTPNNFVPCEELFPQWMTARIILGEFVGKIGGFYLSAEGNDLSLHFEQGYPIEAFPEEDGQKATEIINRTVTNFLPDLSQFLGQQINNMTANNILGFIENNRKEKMYQGKASLKDDLRFSLGITPFPRFEE